MNFELLVTLLITVVVAALGWFVVNHLSSKREREAKRREMIVQYLLEAWRRLENASNRNDNSYSKSLESVIADIQLLGTKKQVELAQHFAEEFAQHREAGLDSLLNDLRSDLRKELKLEIASIRTKHLRIINDSDIKQNS